MKQLQLLTQSSPRPVAPPPTAPTPHRSTGGASVALTLRHRRRSGCAAGAGELAVHTLRLLARWTHPPHGRRSASENRHRTGPALTRPAGPRASTQSVGGAFVSAITQPSVKTLITTVARDDTQLWRGSRRFFYFYFLKRGAAVTTLEDPREGFLFYCFFFLPTLF